MTASSSGPTLIDHPEPPLSAPLTLAFDYTRSVGTTLSKFFTALRERRVLGVRGSDGRVHVPPPEYDPVTYEPLGEMVPVSAVGTVVSWTWQPEPLEGQPLDRPFAWALIKLDGADTPLMHAVDAGDAGDDQDRRPGARALGRRNGGRHHRHRLLRARRRCRARGRASDQDPVTMIVTPVSLTIQHTASHEESAYLRAIAEGKLLGAKTGEKGKVYFPPHGADPATGQPTTEFVELPDKGTVTTFAIINIPFQGQRIKPPYVAAYVLLDGADIPFLHLVADIDAHDVRMGMRVEAVWRPREEWGFGIDNIEYFRPTGEPDAEYDTYKHHL